MKRKGVNENKKDAARADALKDDVKSTIKQSKDIVSNLEEKLSDVPTGEDLVGKWCWLWNEENEKSIMAKIISYQSNNLYKYGIVLFGFYKNAIPLPDEIQKTLDGKSKLNERA